MSIKAFIEISHDKAEQLIEESGGDIGSLEDEANILKLSNHLDGCKKCSDKMENLKKSRQN